jgi:hypothetical protein
MFFLLWCDNFCSPGTGSGSNSYPDPQLCRVFVMVSGRYRHRFLTGLRFYEILRILDVMGWFCFFASHIGDPNCTTEKLLTGFLQPVLRIRNGYFGSGFGSGCGKYELKIRFRIRINVNISNSNPDPKCFFRIRFRNRE